MRFLFDENDYRELIDNETYEDKFVILDAQHFRPEYQEAKNQLFFAKSGFGCYPDKLGGKIFGRLWDEDYQTRREIVLGVAKEEAIQEWEKLYGISRNVFLENR
jgi:hypothetical protein